MTNWGWVYIIHQVDTNYYKFGCTGRTAKKRRQELKTSNPAKLAIVYKCKSYHYKELERHLKHKFEKFLHRNEWFILNKPIYLDWAKTYCERKTRELYRTLPENDDNGQPDPDYNPSIDE